MTHPQPYGYPTGPLSSQVLVQHYRCSTAHVVIAWVLAALTGLYLLPWAVSATRNRSNVAATAMVNLFLGWTLVGWVVALVMACGSERPVVLVQTYAAPPQPWLPQQPQPPYWAPAPPQPQHQDQQQPWTPPVQEWAQPPALPAAAPRAYAPAEPTMVDPLGTEPTQQLPRSPWEPDHRR
ncbi:superinfection immunity protein [Microlunatus antarcticus]|uniref:Superinfection immunity protein n=1 Tax=Microlunatus antarcticus TaxID=53388 RepID=A0A7W5P5X6_9ACTN|nr:superinfection immunity protein [Microlunatus antarcticus]MBB3325909.1 hypothetical protein [Microlunatus antarcticus]